MKILVVWQDQPRSLLLTGLLLCIALASFKASALDPTRSVYQYSCQSWTRQNGLPANGVNAITQTKDGYLWLGTVAGLVRFDGTEFKLIDVGRIPGIRSSIVTSLSASKRGGLWFGLERSAFGYCESRNLSFLGKDEWGGLSQYVHSVLETSDGSTWIAAETQSGRLTKENTYETFPGMDGVDMTSICRGSRGRVWMGTARRGLYWWQNGLLSKAPDNTLDERIIRSLAEDNQGNLWVGTELGLLCYDSKLKKLPLPYPWYETRALLVDRHGAVWAGTSGHGLARFMNNTSMSFRQTDGLVDDFVLSFAEDQEGSLWIGTRNGLSQLSDVKIPTFGKQEGLTANINIAVSASMKGGIWVATSTGFSYFDGTARSYPSEAALRNFYVKQVFEAKNGDLYLINGSMDIEVVSAGKVVARYPNQTWPSAITEDASGVIIAVGGDLYRVGTNSFAPYTFASEQEPAAAWVFNMITSRDGSIWAATSDGLYRVKGGAVTLWTKDDGLADSKALCLCEDTNGTIWVGLEAGISRIRNGQVRNIRRQDGLFDNIAYSMVPDNHGSLWVDSSRGFFRVSLDDLNRFADGKADHVTCMAYDGLDAVKTFERNQQELSGCRTLDGRIWFPTAQGIVMINPTNIAASPVPPPVCIHTVRANGQELAGTSNAVVRPGKGELEFYYAGLGYIAPQKTQYRYKLDGYDKDWVDAGTRRSAFYTNLKPGKYRFDVKACNADGVCGATGASSAVELLPHFYQTAWFLTLTGLLVVVALFGIYGWRVGRLHWKQKTLQDAHDMLEAKVKERTTELAASNASLKGEIEERKRMELEVERIHRQLVDASRLAGQAEVASSVLHNVGNVLNSVNVSATLIAERLRKMRPANLSKVARLLEEHAHDLARFLTADTKGRKLPQYLQDFAQHLGDEQNGLQSELHSLTHNVEHIKEIVAMQQNYARIAGAVEKVELAELADNALKMHAAAYQRHSVHIAREYKGVPPIVVDRHKVLQILINIFQNAKNACDEGGRPDKKVTVRIQPRGQDRVAIEIADNGVGIAPENLTRMFSHGFTTRKNGHGFGLHSAALAAKQLGGTLIAHSGGPGQGATFVLELPLSPEPPKPPEHSDTVSTVLPSERVSP